MFERFTDGARRVVVRAMEEARTLGEGRVGTEHLLLGLALEEQGVAADSLAASSVTYGSIRGRVEATMGGRTDRPPQGPLPFSFTPEAKQAFELSLRESIQLGQRHIGSEHLLLGLIRQRDSRAAAILEELAGDLQRVRDEIRSRIERPAGGTVLREMVRPITVGGIERPEEAEEAEEGERRAVYSEVSGDLTDEAREVLAMAKQSAARRFRREIRAEDLLWALLYQGAPGVLDIVRGLLLEMGADPDRVRVWSEELARGRDGPGEAGPE